MYEGYRKHLDQVTKTATLKSTSGDLIKDRGKQMEILIEQYGEQYSRENIFTDTAMENTTPLPSKEDSTRHQP
jgi:hypothetical protein